MDELYLDNIDEFVNDHNKIVTYKWLSLTLGVHVNTAKKMLYHYLDHKRKESSAQLHATYLVSGKFVDNGQTSHKVSLVKEDQLEDVKSKMSLIVSVHVYSVQKALLKDSGPLYGVDYDAVKDNLKNCSKSSVELQQARQTQPTPAPEPEHKQSPPNGNAAPASKPSTKPQKGIMGMFANKSALKNQDSGKEVKSEQKEDAPAVDEPKSKPPAKANSMMNFFGSQAAKSRQNGEAGGSSSVIILSRAAPAHKTKRMEDSGSEEEKMDKKKRRRIKKPEPDSSDEDDSPQQMETREASPSPKKKVESISQSNGNCEMKTRKRRRVLKSRTFVDDEGCIVTEKGYESESYSEAEDDSQAPKHTPKDPFPAKRPGSSKQDEKKSQKKASANSNKGTKQASIMGFFQKK
ncbi:hypothetical protein FQN60_016748 [Etheostoma spectabile]|uniref:DNA polymerase delta subunit 3 n=1 Tax=Etheostoma spectabile TaxID=54343 RepID=A0A5J5D5C4_9PERO|nr:hypothetical protein FQN60_016197 [Etheostoma spectabile]KAA8587886.1 hypothetical protein FQN60_016748 [Etheostoma spectabile]